MWSIWILCCHLLTVQVNSQEDPCQRDNYRLINDPSRSAGYKGLHDFAQCDTSLASGWYRFDGPAGTTMPMECPDIDSCNTHYPIWINGSLPTSGSTVTVEGCMHEFGVECCSYRWPVQIKDCGEYYVYELQTIREGCFIAYCAGDVSVCDASNPDSLDCSVITPDVGPPTLDIVATSTEFGVKCMMDGVEQLDDIHRYIKYKAWWYSDGHTVDDIGEIVLDRDKLEQQLEQEQLSKLFKTSVHCNVTAHYTHIGRETPWLASAGTYLGIMVQYSIYSELNEMPQDVCSNAQTSTPLILADDCTKSVLIDSTEATWNFHLAAQQSVLRHSMATTVLNISVSSNTLFNGYHDTIAQLNVKAMDTSYPLCALESGSSLLSFNNCTLENYIEGEFLMFYNGWSSLEIRTIHQPCDSVGTCVCAVAVRVVNDVIVVDMCRQAGDIEWNGKTYTNRSLSFKNYRKINSESIINMKTFDSSHHIEFYLPTGGTLLVDVLSPGRLSAVLYAGARDMNEELEGLCSATSTSRSTCDGNAYEQWRIKSSDESFYFGATHGYPGSAGFTETDLCLASGPEKKPYINHCEKPGGRDGCDACIENVPESRPASDYPFSFNGVDHDPQSTWPTKDGWTEAEAENHCAEQILNYEPTCFPLPQTTIQFFYETCITEIRDNGSPTFSGQLQASLKSACLYAVRTDVSSWELIDDRYITPPAITSRLCPYECFNQGNCVQGVCECFLEWRGPYCNISKSTPPQLFYVHGAGTCDLDTEDCWDRPVKLFGSNLAEEVACLIQYGDNNIYTINAQTSYDTVTCPLRYVRDLDQEHIRISVQNPHDSTVHHRQQGIDMVNPRAGTGMGGKSFTNEWSNPLVITVFNSKCQDCEGQGSSVCTAKESMCIINQLCWSQNDINPSDECLWCDNVGESQGGDKWTKNPGCGEDSPIKPFPVAAIVVIVIVLVAFGVFISVVLYISHTAAVRRDRYGAPRTLSTLSLTGSTASVEPGYERHQNTVTSGQSGYPINAPEYQNENHDYATINRNPYDTIRNNDIGDMSRYEDVTSQSNLEFVPDTEMSTAVLDNGTPTAYNHPQYEAYARPRPNRQDNMLPLGPQQQYTFHHEENDQNNGDD